MPLREPTAAESLRGAFLPAVYEILVLPLGLLLCISISLLQDPQELFLVACDLGKVIIGEFAPFGLDLALDLLPCSLQNIGIQHIYLPGERHCTGLFSFRGWRPRNS
jgi:hypothetical protein